MKKRFLLPLCAVLLSGCRTSILYPRNLYNSPVFDENYYLIYDDSGVDSQDIVTPVAPQQVVLDQSHSSFKQHGYDYALSNKSDKFKHGVLSKLYDGRTECGSLFQLSRVQLDKSGFGTRLPETIDKATRFEFVARGGSAKSSIAKADFKFDFFVDVVCEEGGKKVMKSFELNDIAMHTDNNSETTMVTFTFPEIKNISYYQIKFNCVDSRLPSTCTDDYMVKEKDHLAIMLYEVLIN